MRYTMLLLLLLPLLGSSQTIYVVRHAEKEAVAADADRMLRADPPLSAAGMARAQSLLEKIGADSISEVWSTPYQRTRATVQAVAEKWNRVVQSYSPRADSTAALIHRLAQLETGTVLIAGHSNTVDDLVNGFTGEKTIPGDLDESRYGDLFILRKKDGKFVLEIASF